MLAIVLRQFHVLVQAVLVLAQGRIGRLGHRGQVLPRPKPVRAQGQLEFSSRRFSIQALGLEVDRICGKGKAKKEAGIRAKVLPPHTPCWMPLDYASWDKIMHSKQRRQARKAKMQVIYGVRACFLKCDLRLFIFNIS